MPATKKRRPPARSRTFATAIMNGVAEINAMLRDGARPEDRFVVRTVRSIDVRPPNPYSATAIRKLRAELDVTQAVFADLLGVPLAWIRAWELGEKEPTPLARRLLETIAADPAAWVARVAVSP